MEEKHKIAVIGLEYVGLPLANTNSGCIYPIYGCTDPTFNYHPYVQEVDHTNLSVNPLELDKKYAAIIVAVAHKMFKNYTVNDFR